MNNKVRFFKVGGSIRDELIGRESSDNDFVVLNASPEYMLSKGFKQVGKDFPVFIHPITKDEYALARRDISTGPRHDDFKFEWQNVTLEEDASRRDFTINSLYREVEIDSNGHVEYQYPKIIDFNNGYNDINHGIIRINNENHFLDDPLRILRAIRFTVTLNCDIDTNTFEILTSGVKSGALNHISSDRIYGELYKMFASGVDTLRAIMLLNDIGAIEAILPEIHNLKFLDEPKKYHLTGNTFLHTLYALNEVKDKSPAIKWSVLCHDIGKTLTSYKHWQNEKFGYVPLIENLRINEWPNWKEFESDLRCGWKLDLEKSEQFKKEGKTYYYRHDDEVSLMLFDNMAKRLRFPNNIKNLCKTSIKYHMQIWKVAENETTEKRIVDILHDLSHNFDLDLLEHIKDFIEVCKADNYSDKNYEEDLFPIIKDRIIDYIEFCSSITLKSVPNYLDILPELRSETIRVERIKRLKQYRKEISNA